MTPAVRSDTTTAWGSSGEDSVQSAQRGQVKVQIIKRPAANILLGFPSEGKLRPQAVMRCSAKRVTEHKVTFSPANGSASGTYTSSGGVRRHLPLKGEGKVVVAPHG